MDGIWLFFTSWLQAASLSSGKGGFQGSSISSKAASTITKGKGGFIGSLVSGGLFLKGGFLVSNFTVNFSLLH